jgi:hypothetical protein
MSLYSVAIYGHMYEVCSLRLKPFYSVSLYSYGLNDGENGKALLFGPSIQYTLIRTIKRHCDIHILVKVYPTRPRESL